MKLLPGSLRAQVTVGACALVTIVIAGAGLAIAVRIDDQDRDQVDEQLAARASKVLADSSKALGGDVLLEEDKPPAEDDLLAGTDSLTRVLSNDQVVAQRGQGVEARIPLPQDEGLSTVQIGGRPWRSLVQPIDGVPEGRLQILQSLAPLEDRLDDNRRLIALVTVAGMAVTAIAAWFFAGAVLRPLERLRTGAQAIGPGQADQRLPAVERPNEIRELSTTLNAMLERLQRSMEATRRFTADAGHELRTPLTGLGADLETLLRNPELPFEERQQMLGAMAVEHQRIVALLNGLQQLARGDAEALPARTETDLTLIATQAIDAARRRFPQVSFDQAFDDDPVRLDGWPEGIRLALDNLLENAAVHGRDAGSVVVELSVNPDEVRICVSDDGAGIEASAREAMTQRFARGPETRNDGSGLGLALIEQQARLLGGALELSDSPSGGLSATVRLPRNGAQAGA